MNISQKVSLRDLVSTILRRGLLAAVLPMIGLVLTEEAKASLVDVSSTPTMPVANISDVYFFRSWSNPDNAVIIFNVHAGQTPGIGSSFNGFSDNVIYKIGIDNNMDGDANDVLYTIRFQTELRSSETGSDFWPYFNNSGAPFLGGITSLSGPGSEGLLVRQSYSVVESKKGPRKRPYRMSGMFAAPPNVGPRTMPEYESLAAQALYLDASSGIKVFAGPRAETVYTDVRAVFDSLGGGRFPPFLSEAEDLDGHSNSFGVNSSAGMNVNSIALEIPISRLTLDGGTAESTNHAFLGVYVSSHEKVSGRYKYQSGFRQLDRMGNPSVAAMLIALPHKEDFNQSNPKNDAQFQEFIKSPSIATAFPVHFGLEVPPFPRNELVEILFRYPGQPLIGGNCDARCSELLRLNIAVPPTLPQNQSRLGALLSPDPAGLPNGRRPNDDVIDITLRAIGGPMYFQARLGDGVNFLDAAPGAGTNDGPGYGTIPGNRLDITTNGITAEFPFLPTPHSGGIN